MTAWPELEQPELTFPSAPVSEQTAATLALVNSDWQAERDWDRFHDACLEVADHGVVDPNRVRALVGGSIEPRRYSAFWNRAASKRAGFLDADGWVINDDTIGGNAGKPLRRYRLRSAA